MANTIADKLAYLEETKGLIKEAIIAKGGTVSDEDTFRSYANKIKTIQSGGSGTVNLPDGTKFVNSTFTTVSDSIISYLEAQTDLSGIFENCKNLTTVPSFDAKATTMSSMFKNCSKLQTVSQINTSNVTTMQDMFYICTSLQTVPLFNTSNVTTMENMFLNCTSLTSVPQFVTANVNNMYNMFNSCTSLTSVPLFNTSNVTTMENMFYSCTSLTSVPQFVTSKVTNMSSMFMSCTSLQTVPQLDTSNVSNMSYIFYDCSSLTNLGGLTGLKQDLELAYCPKLTVDSVMNVINNAADMTSSPKTLTLLKDTFDKLSEDQIAIASAKGWNIAHW